MLFQNVLWAQTSGSFMTRAKWRIIRKIMAIFVDFNLKFEKKSRFEAKQSTDNLIIMN